MGPLQDGLHMVDLSEKHFLEIFEELIKTRWSNTVVASQDWTNQTGINVGYFHGTLQDGLDGCFE